MGLHIAVKGLVDILEQLEVSTLEQQELTMELHILDKDLRGQLEVGTPAQEQL